MPEMGTLFSVVARVERIDDAGWVTFSSGDRLRIRNSRRIEEGERICILNWEGQELNSRKTPVLVITKEGDILMNRIGAPGHNIRYNLKKI